MSNKLDSLAHINTVKEMVRHLHNESTVKSFEAVIKLAEKALHDTPSEEEDEMQRWLLVGINERCGIPKLAETAAALKEDGNPNNARGGDMLQAALENLIAATARYDMRALNEVIARRKAK